MVLPTSGTISISDINSCARFTNGNMGINTTSPNYNLDINGTLKATTITTGTILATTSVSSGALHATNSTVTNAVSTNVSSGTLNLSTGLTAGTILATTSVSSGALHATNSTVTNAVSTNASSGTLNLSTGLTAGTILATTSVSSGAVNATNSTVTNSVATNSSISNLVSLNSTIANLRSTVSTIGTLRTDLGVMSDAIMVKASILTSLTVPNLLASTSISSGALHATNSTVTNFVATSITAGPIFASNNVNASQSIVVQNTDSGSSAYSALTLATDQSNFNIFKNSTTRTADGGANTTTIRNDGGPLRLQSNTGMGIWVGSTGNVGINTTVPGSSLDVKGDSSWGLTRLAPTTSGGETAIGFFALNDFTASGQATSGNWLLGTGINNGGASNFTLLRNTTNMLTVVTNGNIGIGTTSPTTKLNVSGATDVFGPLRVGSNSSSTEFIINLGTSGVGGYRSGYLYGSGTNIELFNQQNGHIVFGTNNTNKVQIAANGNVTINGLSGSYPLTVFGSSNSGSIGGYAGWSGNYGWQNQTTSYDVSIYSQYFMMSGQGFVSVSDQRIKKDIIEIEDGESLSILRQIEPKRYRYIDEYKRGTDYVYGFIAQQVRGVLPAASGLVKDFIPSIMTSATVSYDSTNDITTVTLVDNKQHNLTSENSNSRVRFFDENDQNTDLELHEIVSGDIFKVKGELKGVNTFAYGVEVDDFHTLNKDAIFTVALSALQQVDKELQETKQTVNDLLQRIQALENAN